MEKVGFQKVELIGETGFNSTPKTKGVLFRAEKPVLSAKVVKSPVVFDNRIISCSGPGSALDVAFLLMEHLLGSKTSQEVRKFMIYKNE